MDEEFCRFTEKDSVLLRPHSSFLTKNGLRKRIDTREIQTIIGTNGQVSKICPVLALREYLNLTDRHTRGSLFLSSKNRTALTISLLRHHICSLITEANPDTRAKVHDIKKYAASITLQQDMLVGDLAIFYKFYFMQTEHPGMPVSVPARS